MQAPFGAGPFRCRAALSVQGGAFGVIFVEIRQITRRDWLSAPKDGPAQPIIRRDGLRTPKDGLAPAIIQLTTS